ncbi:hypothetical protein CAPTEDRAFT_189173 [Capitella teleta]|uniref:Uncharacterized protein n=1 Tax=Capitella teleta TaxID=283909 RepID=R7UQ77_CAPTE|nr:hypothetical protein CAPTEDRAFT_189173 [Capitella teleta]|eukprot:ELU08268.1 hypothetical protein CAPTEDRAFT_189173 [Capitella teleta]
METTPGANSNSAIEGSDDDTASDIESLTGSGLTNFSWKRCFCSEPAFICIYLMLTLTLLSSFLTVVIVTAVVLSPFAHARGFSDTTCSVVNSTRRPLRSHCPVCSGTGCSLPCIVVFVVFPVGQLENQTARLKEDESQLHSTCTLQPNCKQSSQQIERRTAEYEAAFGVPGASFPCFANGDEVIRTRRFQESHVLHGMIWPSFLFLLSSIILVAVVRRRHCTSSVEMALNPTAFSCFNESSTSLTNHTQLSTSAEFDLEPG